MGALQSLVRSLRFGWPLVEAAGPGPAVQLAMMTNEEIDLVLAAESRLR
jgi:hypothetical protein